MPIYPLLLSVIFIVSCNGQNITLLLKDRTAAEKTPLTRQPKIIKDKPPGIVYCGLEDRLGKLWFGTSAGVYCYDGQAFTHFTVQDGLGNNNVGSMLEDKAGNLWFGTNIGLSRYNGKTFTRLLIPETGSTDFLPFRGAEDLKKSPVYPYVVTSMAEDKNGNLWFGTREGGVYRYDGKSFTGFLSTEVVRCLLADKTGHIWLGSWSNGGVYRYDGESFINVTKQVGLQHGMICCLLEDKFGNIWLGTRDEGAYRYDGKSSAHFLDSLSVMSLLEDKFGNIWLGTDAKWGQDGNGVYRYDGKSLTNFTTKDGLPNNNVFCIVEDKIGNIWFGTREDGLCRYDGKSFTEFTEQGIK